MHEYTMQYILAKAEVVGLVLEMVHQLGHSVFVRAFVERPCCPGRGIYIYDNGIIITLSNICFTGFTYHFDY